MIELRFEHAGWLNTELQPGSIARQPQRPKQRAPSETFKNGQWRRWQEAALSVIVLIPLTTAVILVALFPDLSIAVKAGVIAGLIVVVVPASRLYRASLKHREGIAQRQRGSHPQRHQPKPRELPVRSAERDLRTESSRH